MEAQSRELTCPRTYGCLHDLGEMKILSLAGFASCIIIALIDQSSPVVPTVESSFLLSSSHFVIVVTLLTHRILHLNNT